MTLPDTLARLPDEATVPMWYVREQLEAVKPEPKVIGITEATELWSYGRETWRKAAAAGEIEGAWQDTENGPWRLPLESCESYVRDRQRTGSRRGKKGPKGPRSHYTRPASRLQGREMVEGGSTSVGREAGDAPGPSGPRLAS